MKINKLDPTKRLLLWICILLFYFLSEPSSLPGTCTPKTFIVSHAEEVLEHSCQAGQLRRQKRRNAYLGNSAFIGSSIGVGQQMYFKSKGNGFLGNPVMLVRGCYSFMNDASSSDEYKITYKGVPYRARDAIALCGAERVFINMGTNDMWLGTDGVKKAYVKYLVEIRRNNPEVVIFIESMTHVQAGKENSHLNNPAIDQLNSFLEDFCKKHKDLYFIDVSSALRSPDGSLRPDCCSDGYVHISTKGYEIWTNTLCRYVDHLLDMEESAEKAVETYAETGSETDYQKAWHAIDILEKSTVKQTLRQRLRKYQGIQKQASTDRLFFIWQNI